MQNTLISKFIAISKVQKSVADLEKLYRERTGVNFVIPSTRHRQEKVLVTYAIELHFCSTPLLNLTLWNFFHVGSEGSTICGSILRKGTIQFY